MPNVVGQEYTAFVKSKWKSWSLWWGRLLIGLGGYETLMYMLDSASSLQPYMGKHSAVVLFAFGAINQILRYKTKGAVK